MLLKPRVNRRVESKKIEKKAKKYCGVLDEL